MTAMTEHAMRDPVEPDEVDVLQAVFDAVAAERSLHRQSVEALDVARNVLRFYFDGVHDYETLLALMRVELSIR